MGVLVRGCVRFKSGYTFGDRGVVIKMVVMLGQLHFWVGARVRAAVRLQVGTA